MSSGDGEPPAKHQDFADAATLLGGQLPVEIVKIYSHHNGGGTGRTGLPQPDGRPLTPAIPDDYLLPLEEWKVCADMMLEFPWSTTAPHLHPEDFAAVVIASSDFRCLLLRQDGKIVHLDADVEHALHPRLEWDTTSIFFDNLWQVDWASPSQAYT